MKKTENTETPQTDLATEIRKITWTPDKGKQTRPKIDAFFKEFDWLIRYSLPEYVYRIDVRRIMPEHLDLNAVSFKKMHYQSLPVCRLDKTVFILNEEGDELCQVGKTYSTLSWWQKMLNYDSSLIWLIRKWCSNL